MLVGACGENSNCVRCPMSLSKIEESPKSVTALSR